MNTELTIDLQKAMFLPRETPLFKYEDFAVSTFRFASEVEALRLCNSRGEIVVLPYHGQQVWDATFDGHRLTMRSIFDEPTGEREYLKNYGAFLIHCGATAVGNPGPRDNHPLHGELPNAPYSAASLLVGEDPEGPYVTVTGTYIHSVAFGAHYRAEPSVKMHSGSSILECRMTLTNLSRTSMEMMYLQHINFRPVDHSVLHYTAPCGPQNVRVRDHVPQGVTGSDEYRAFISRLQENPALLNVIDPSHVCDPEIVMYLDYRPDSDGWSHTLLELPNGAGAYVGHRPEELPRAVRWISRTGDYDAIGIVLPSTAEVDGYHAEKEKGNVQILGAGKKALFTVRVGFVRPQEAKNVKSAIERTMRLDNA